MYLFNEVDIYTFKSNLFQNYNPSKSICFLFQINIMHEYTETKSKYTGKIGTYKM